jgi:putative endonuclease
MMTWLYRLADLARDRGRRRVWADEQASGRRGEDLAHRFVRRRGMVIVARNYLPPFGGADLDLVGWKDGKLTFIEVKSRAAGDFEAPERAVNAEKERLLERSARDYARRAGVEWGMARFDIVSVVFGKPPRIEWFQDAFGPRGGYNTKPL